MSLYIHQRPNWPHFTWEESSLTKLMGDVRYLQGLIGGRMEALGFSVRSEAMLQTLTQDVLKSTEIEGELLDPEQVRSSIARRLGMDIAGLISSGRNVDGMVEMMLDATQNYQKPLTKDRLFGWQSSLFPSGRSGMYKIIVGAWRDNEKGPMLVVSGPMGRERVHFEAPHADFLEEEVDKFLAWFNNADDSDPVLKAGVAHLWFVTVHPFDDGNGRIARAITDMQLARADRGGQRYYSMSGQIRQERNAYYTILEKAQRGDLDITEWLEWFLNCLCGALNVADEKLESVLGKARFWDTHGSTSLNERQRLIINKLHDGFVGKLTSSKWAKIAKCSRIPPVAIYRTLSKRAFLKKKGLEEGAPAIY